MVSILAPTLRSWREKLSKTITAIPHTRNDIPVVVLLLLLHAPSDKVVVVMRRHPKGYKDRKRGDKGIYVASMVCRQWSATMKMLNVKTTKDDHSQSRASTG